MTKSASITLAMILLLGISAKAQKRTHLPMHGGKLLALLDTAIKTGQSEEAARVVRTLVVLGHHGKRAIAKRLKHPEDTATPYILTALSRMQPDMRLLAKPLLSHKESTVREQAAMAMAGTSHEHLMRCYDRERNPAVREALIESLAQSDDESITDFLLSQLQSPDAGIRIRSVNGLALRTASNIANEMYAIIRDAEPSVRHAGIQALGVIGTPSTLRVLLDLVPIESNPANVQAIFDALRAITGQSFGNNIDAWKRWLGAGS